MSPEEVSAVAAVTAAVATLVLACLTFGYLRATQALVRMASRQADAASGQLDAQLQPVLALASEPADAAPGGLRSGAASAEAHLRVHNVGLGVALVTAIKATGAAGTVRREATGLMIAAGQPRTLTVEAKRSEAADWDVLRKADADGRVQLEVHYRDVVGREDHALHLELERIADAWRARTT